VIEGTLIGFDFGSRRIGVAVGETSTRIASPLTAIEGEANDARFEAIGRSSRSGARRDSWSESRTTPTARNMRSRSWRRSSPAAWKRATACPVKFVDETLTSAEAESSLRATRTRPGRKSDVDALAATLILQSFLDELPRAAARDSP
jgi:putative Holliday junction resolvase